MKSAGKQFLGTVLVAALILGASVTVSAAQGNGYQAQPYGQGLSQEQQRQAQQIYQETLASTNSAREALNAKRSQLDQELASPNPDGARIESLSREIGELRGQLLAARAQARSRLSQQGLPPDCLSGCWGDRGMMMTNGWQYAPGAYYHHGRGHGRHRGHGHWRDFGMGMMGW